MFQYDKLLEALRLPLKAMIGGTLATGAVLVLDSLAVVDLDAFGSTLVRPVIIIALACFATLSAVGLADYLLAPMREKRKATLLASRRAVRRQEEEESVAAARARALAHLDHLSEQEVYHVAESLRSNSPTFYTWVHSSGASMLMGKGLVWNPGSQHNQDNYPFCFYDFAWKEILARKDDFLAREDAYSRARKGQG